MTTCCLVIWPLSFLLFSMCETMQIAVNSVTNWSFFFYYICCFSIFPSNSIDSKSGVPLLSTLNLTTVTLSTTIFLNLKLTTSSWFRTVLHVLWLKPLNLLLSHLSSDFSTGSRSTNALNINSFHLPTKFSQPANLTIYTIWSLFSLQVEPAPHLLSP